MYSRTYAIVVIAVIIIDIIVVVVVVTHTIVFVKQSEFLENFRVKCHQILFLEKVEPKKEIICLFCYEFQKHVIE